MDDRGRGENAPVALGLYTYYMSKHTRFSPHVDSTARHLVILRFATG
jgi:hypothetical protein